MMRDLPYRSLVDSRATIFVLKPDGVRRGLQATAEADLRTSGFRILARAVRLLSQDDVKAVYRCSFRRDFPDGEHDERTGPHIAFMRAGPVCAYLVQHDSLAGNELYGNSSP